MNIYTDLINRMIAGKFYDLQQWEADDLEQAEYIACVRRLLKVEAEIRAEITRQQEAYK